MQYGVARCQHKHIQICHVLFGNLKFGITLYRHLYGVKSKKIVVIVTPSLSYTSSAQRKTTEWPWTRPSIDDEQQEKDEVTVYFNSSMPS